MDTGTRQARRGHGRATLKQVAQAAGVTAITVSRYLREPHRVAPATVQRIEAAIAATGYVPNKQAGLLASGVSNIVAALVPNLANSIFAETVQGLSDGLREAGFELLIASTGYSLEREAEQLQALAGWHPAGIVVTGRRHTEASQRLLQTALQAGTPVVELWDWQDNPGSGVAQVGFSHEAVGAAMAEHLLRAGHRSMAYVDSGVAEDYRAHERGLAFAATARAAGAHVVVLVGPPADAFDAGRQVMGDLLRLRAPEPTAAAFANDNLACGALLEAQRRGLRVPQQMALMGFGDFPIARQMQPPLSTVGLPRYELGLAGAQTLLRALRDGEAAQGQQLPWTLLARGSTGGS
jgi:LacI family transcriptional regulator, gluconate utilization system Gnt-I transcriptional repressor